MSENLKPRIVEICKACGNDRTRMMDVVRTVAQEFGCVSSAAMDIIASQLSTHRVEVESVVSFYAFLSDKPKGKVVIRLCNDIIDRMHGAEAVAHALSQELGIEFGETTADGMFSLDYAPCIGMCDQVPAALVNDVVVTRLGADSARQLVRELKQHGNPQRLVKEFGDGNNAHDLVRSMVVNNIRKKGPVIFGEREANAGLRNALAMSPNEVIRAVKTARLRGRGGAGFPTGMKWEFTRGAAGDDKVVVCNADEGEPGTFKDRVILTECPDLLIEGMTIAGYAIGAQTGIIYLRGEYAYLRPLLESVLQSRREAGLLGKDICGRQGFSFDVMVQMGAGAYVCGEETALLSSCEGKRGDPKNRPPFPAQKGYLGRPTAVNNVETICCAARILEKGAGWFSQLGNGRSSGTKLLSVSGDCRKPGVYELEFGISIAELLAKVGADDAIAVQVGGASGSMIAPKDYSRVICFEDLATGGSVMVFGPGRDLLQVVAAFVDFFVEESCGYCTPCRVGNTLLKKTLARIREGKGEPADLGYLEKLGGVMKAASRCGLGQTAANPVLTTLANLRGLYEAVVKEETTGMQPGFDIRKAVALAEQLQGRKSVHV